MTRWVFFRFTSREMRRAPFGALFFARQQGFLTSPRNRRMTERKAEGSCPLAPGMDAGADWRLSTCSPLKSTGPRVALNCPQRFRVRGSRPNRLLDDQEPTKRKVVSISLRSGQ